MSDVPSREEIAVRVFTTLLGLLTGCETDAQIQSIPAAAVKLTDKLLEELGSKSISIDASGGE